MTEKIIIKIPIDNKKWWQFWKKSDKKKAHDIMRKYKEMITITDSDVMEYDYWIPCN
jgi:hypothetical protein